MSDSRDTVAENAFMEQQAAALLASVGDTLTRVPPALREPSERRLALLLLDGVLHEEEAATRAAVQAFHRERIAAAADDIERTSVAEGARIWKLYNHGFVIRTASVTFAFDLVRGTHVAGGAFAVDDAVMDRLAEACDAMFISHRHGDHADPVVAEAFLSRGKAVVTPPTVWEGETLHERVTHPQRGADTQHSLPIQGGAAELRVVAYPGFHDGHDGLPNNVTLVTTPEGMGFLHTGDQADPRAFTWIDTIAESHQVDVLMPNCWTTDIVRMIHGVRPAVVITGHENEMAHTIDHREPYWLTYERQLGSDRWGGSRHVGYDAPLVLMSWGESFHHSPGG
ncbi:hypothetical protein HN371_15020 [Candidatus Poribacteria bacterium]|jgi:L-ascorbate metabolism protein UlaG (beta-lactamase superfamily)|nr:hypothetical protein [Candidatus Poribacteria bacterium]MBT5534624.1 hypothetical protein [Candidatus Poribacteria bacterium]MBT5710354.1 hypothetical protein [Candidatus Poribacteria bacterium]MBT7099443.1 hypothetical protein [Candidatus Poribacteria bacterium]MBT7804196.1 hypothetical protein [Candidatus Poribacteria bacterium]